MSSLNWPQFAAARIHPRNAPQAAIDSANRAVAANSASRADRAASIEKNTARSQRPRRRWRSAPCTHFLLDATKRGCLSREGSRMTAPSKLLVAFAVAALAVLLARAASADRPAPSSSGRKPPAETPVQIMPAGIYPLTPEREQALRPKDSFKECDACPEMVVVPKGAFIMGTPITEVDRSKGEDPLHRVTFARPFAVGRFTISFDEWDACLADGGCGGNKGDDKFGRGRMPAQGINFEAAKSYLAWLSRKVGRTYRLPSESELEYFSRAGTTTPFWFGNTISSQNANY
jgi:formylglycine-generating enzyme required for sulfatase activity